MKVQKKQDKAARSPETGEERARSGQRGREELAGEQGEEGRNEEVKSIEAPRKVLAINTRDQPLELHLAGRVLVLPARGQAELTMEESRAAPVQVLANRNALALVEGADMAPPTETTPEGSPAPDRPARTKRE